MKLALTQTLVNALSVDRLPDPDLKPKDWPENPARKTFLVSDTHKDAPSGFGVIVNRESASYYVQRRLRSSQASGAVKRVNISKTTDIYLARARDIAREKADELERLERNPNVVERQRESCNLILGEAFPRYRRELLTRKRPATANTIKTLDKATKKTRALAQAAHQ